MKTAKITKRKLQARGACEEDVATFAKTWPDGMTITAGRIPSLARKIADLDLDSAWAGARLLKDGPFREYLRIIWERSWELGCRRATAFAFLSAYLKQEGK